VKLGKMTAKENQEAQEALDKLERDSDQFYFCPTLFEFIAVPAR